MPVPEPDEPGETVDQSPRWHHVLRTLLRNYIAEHGTDAGFVDWLWPQIQPQPPDSDRDRPPTDIDSDATVPYILETDSDATMPYAASETTD